MPQRVFSWEQAKKEAIEMEIAVEKVHAKRGNQEDKLNHPDWVKLAQTNDFKDLVIKTTERIKKYQDNAMARRAKRAGTK